MTVDVHIAYCLDIAWSRKSEQLRDICIWAWCQDMSPLDQGMPLWISMREWCSGGYLKFHHRVGRLCHSNRDLSSKARIPWSRCDCKVQTQHFQSKKHMYRCGIPRILEDCKSCLSLCCKLLCAVRAVRTICLKMCLASLTSHLPSC